MPLAHLPAHDCGLLGAQSPHIADSESWVGGGPVPRFCSLVVRQLRSNPQGAAGIAHSGSVPLTRPTRATMDQCPHNHLRDLPADDPPDQHIVSVWTSRALRYSQSEQYASNRKPPPERRRSNHLLPHNRRGLPGATLVRIADSKSCDGWSALSMISCLLGASCQLSLAATDWPAAL